MGYSIDVTKYKNVDNEKVQQQNRDFSFNKKEFNWYEDIFKEAGNGDRRNGTVLAEIGAFYSLFIPMNDVLYKIAKKYIKSFRLHDRGWECADSEDNNEWLVKHISFLNFSGGSDGWTWTWEEILRLKEMLIEEGEWEAVAEISTRKPGGDCKTIGAMFNLTIKEKALLVLW